MSVFNNVVHRLFPSWWAASATPIFVSPSRNHHLSLPPLSSPIEDGLTVPLSIGYPRDELLQVGLRLMGNHPCTRPAARRSALAAWSVASVGHAQQ